MTKQFTTPCYIRIDDAQQRKEICEKLIKSGYVAINMAESIDSNYLFAFDGWISRLYGRGLRGEQGKRELEYASFIDCGTNIPLFLDLAAMRSDTDKGQLFICHKALSECQYMVGEMSRCHDDEQSLFINPGQYLRRATAQEIINHHKQKGETK